MCIRDSSYTSDSSSSYCDDESFGTTGSGSSEGSYSCGSSSSYVPTYSGEDNSDNDGAYAPGRGQKPAPKPQPKPAPAQPPPAPPPAEPPPSGGTGL